MIRRDSEKVICLAQIKPQILMDCSHHLLDFEYITTQKKRFLKVS